MRSELVFKALTHESNRYQLVRLVAKGTRKLHRPNSRIQETMNAVLEHFSVTVSAGDEEMLERRPEQQEMLAA
jgi:hypothetical protein